MTIRTYALLTAEGDVQAAVEDMEQQIGVLQRYLDELPDRIFSMGIRVMMAMVLFAVGTRVIAFIRNLMKRALEKFSASKEAVQFLDSCAKAVLYVVLIFMILQLFGLQATSIATVLGSVGVTVGLAVQGSLSNCIGGILILTLKPFKVGDFIIEDTYKNQGVVQEISIFYTKLMTYDNKVILIPNGTLANCSLTNVTDNPERRVELSVGISYKSDIRLARQVIEKLAQENPKVLKERGISVFVDSYGESSIQLGVHFWTKKEDWWSAKCEMLEAIKYAFDEAGVEIPYNQLDVHVVQD